MTQEIRNRIRLVIHNAETIDKAVDEICGLIDSELSKVLSESSKIGEILDAVGLEIRPKEQS